MVMTGLNKLTVLLRGGGDIATGIALRLYRSGFRRIVILETAQPLAVRRRVAFSEAVYESITTVEGIFAILVHSPVEVPPIWENPCSAIPVLIDPAGIHVPTLRPDVVIEATLAKANVGVSQSDAPLVIGVGPGFVAGSHKANNKNQIPDVHYVVETNRGPNLGRVIAEGSAEPDTGKPGVVNGYSLERVLRAPESGIFTTDFDIGDHVKAGDVIAHVGGRAPCHAVRAAIGGQIRGLLRPGVYIGKGGKVGDIEPRENVSYHHVSDKALAVGGGVLQIILEAFNSPPKIRNGIFSQPLSSVCSSGKRRL